jgi:hypothetical protein
MKMNMCRAALFACALAASPLLETSARAQADQYTADVRCLLVSMRLMVAAGDENVKTAAMFANLYYFGRLDGRVPPAELESRLRDEISRMTPETANEEALRCGDAVNDRVLAAADLGARLIGR